MTTSLTPRPEGIESLVILLEGSPGRQYETAGSNFREVLSEWLARHDSAVSARALEAEADEMDAHHWAWVSANNLRYAADEYRRGRGGIW